MTAGTDRSRLLLPAAIGSAIVVASLVPVPVGRDPSQVVPFGADAWAHAVGYAALSASLGRALQRGPTTGRRTVLIATVAPMILGVALELLQTTVPTRSFDPADLASNAVGIVLGLGVWWLSRR